MTAEYVHITLQLIAAVFAGGVIGFERSFHGRPAGFRTHALVCTASSLLMLVTLMVIRTMDRANAGRLAQTLTQRPDVLEFRISPTGD